MPIELIAALIGLGGALLAVALSATLRVGRSERFHPGRLREYLMIRDAELQLDERQAGNLDFEIAWSAARTLGFPADYRLAERPRDRFEAILSALGTVLFILVVGSLVLGRIGGSLGYQALAVVGLTCVFGSLQVLVKRSLHRRWYRRWLRESDAR